MIDILYENIQWVFSGVGVPLLIYFLLGKRKEDKPQKEEVRGPEKLIIENTEQELSIEEQEDNYRTSVGK
ncbi:hypothetical protein ACPV3O_23140 [Vibrio rotiferianus]|uniref:hypothetical protein n=1 Tax=Vibrio rotiferianus TaxID=190895 RepID=UPI00406A17B2